jgi:hypothetical protein
MIFRFACLAAALIAIGLVARNGAERADDEFPVVALSNGATSPDELVSRLLAALAVNDRTGIERLRVDENEYRRLIMPGSVQPGSPPQLMPENKSKYFWQRHDTLSLYSLAGILKGYAGQSFRLKRIDYPRVEQFAWYSAYRDPIAHLETEAGETVDLPLGSIAEYRGRYKFISYHFD